MTCTFLAGIIDAEENVGDSLPTINDNFQNLSDGLCDVVTDVTDIQEKINDPVTYLGSVPIGGIIIYSGNISSLPSNWSLCDGTGGTPNLVDRFVIGAGGAYATGATGGTASITLSTANLPAHNHGTVTSSVGSPDSHTHTGNTTCGGNHDHTFYASCGDHGSIGGYRYPLMEGPAVCDNLIYAYKTDGYTGGFCSGLSCLGAGSGIGNPLHSHCLSTGTGGSHTHNITPVSVGSSTPIASISPYYALAYIMRLS